MIRDSYDRILICGDRNWTDKQYIREVLESLETKPKYIIEGEANGADTCGKNVAKELGIPIMTFPAEWDKYGLSAGYIRNKRMLDEGKPNIVLAFHDDISNSKGTKNMLEIAKNAGIRTVLYKHE